MSIEEKLKRILETRAFDQLASYKEAVSWDSMTLSERELLAMLFIKQGEQQFQQADSSVLESFEIAAKVAPQSPMVFFRQALVYAAQGQNMRCLKAADKALERAVQLDPFFISAWHSWGNILVRIGVCSGDTVYFQQADEKFLAAERLANDTGAKSSESLYWHWGICWYHLGKHSGEAIDFFRSLERFRQAQTKGLEFGEFYNDYGTVLIDLACLIGKKEFFIEAVEYYEKATTLAPSNYEGWLNLACTYQRLFGILGSREYFQKADECFQRASSMQHEEAVIWFRWAELYANAGKISRNLHYLQTSFEKFKESESIEAGNPYVMLRWSEAQVIAASLGEDLELLRDSEAKIALVLKALPQHPEAWYIYGLCLNEFGRYFESAEHYVRALDQFKRGLEIKNSHPLLMYGMALAYFALGELTSDGEAIEQSIKLFSKIAELEELLLPQFLSDWGIALMKLGEMTNDSRHVEAAAAKFEEAISRRLNSPLGQSLEPEEVELEWFYNYGCAMDFLGDLSSESVYYEKAIQVFLHVLKLEPEYIHARYNLALALSHLGELNSDVECFNQALEQFDMVLLHDPEDEIAWNDCGLALLHLAMLTVDPVHSERVHELFNQAEGKFQQAAALGSLHAYYNLACLYALTSHPASAIHYLEKAEQCDALPPTDDILHDEWLDSLHNQSAYRLFISRLLNKQSD